MKKTIFSFIIILLSAVQAKAYTVLPHSPATFTDLSAAYVVATTGQGKVSANDISALMNPYEKEGVINGRHTLIDKQGTDPNTGGALPLLPEGETQVIRLGNSNIDAESEAIAYHFIVDKDHAVLLLKFAVVLEDPDHSPVFQPRFVVRIKDKNGNLIESCAEYNVSAAANIPGFQTYNKSYSSPIRWRPWTNVGLDLSRFTGREVSVEFVTYDCAQWGHFGYAYYTAQCVSNNLTMSNCTSGNFTLEAPAGFASYQWENGDKTQSSTRNTASATGTDISCVVTSVTGCQFTLYGKISGVRPDKMNIRDTICEGESYRLHDFDLPPQTETGEKLYYKTYLDPANCDDNNTVELSLLVVPRYTRIEAEICQGNDYTDNGFDIIQPSAGVRYDTIMVANTAECTQYKCLKLTVNPALNFPTVIHGDPTPCTGELSSYSFDGAGSITTYEWQLPANAVVYDQSTSVVTVYFTNDTPGNITLKARNGCGSQSIHLPVTPRRAYNLFYTESICKGEYFNRHNFNLGRQDSTGLFVFTRHLASSAGCDSTVTLSLSVSPVPQLKIVASDSLVCNAGDKVSLVANTTDTNIELNKTPDDATIFIQDCSLKYLWNTGDTTAAITVSPTQTTEYICTVTSSGGCSVEQRKLIIVNTAAPVIINATICAGETYTAYGLNANATGTYNTTFVQDGCSIPVTLYLTVNDKYEQTLYATVCEGGTFAANGFHLTPYQAGVVTETLYLKSISACDSIIHLQLTVNPVQKLKLYDTICVNQPYTLHGFNLPAQTIPGKFTYTQSVSSPDNCINTTTLYLAVNPRIENIISDEGVVGSRYQAYNFDELLDKNGLLTYTHTLPSVKTGCDSTVILNLKVTGTLPVTTTLSAAICAGETYSFGGINRTTAGVYTDTLTAAAGNDSIVILNLTVNPVYKDTVAHTICQGEKYYFQGNNYTQEGNYTAYLKTKLGCDSIVTLALHVLPAYDIRTELHLCANELPYTYADTVFLPGTSSGYYILKRKTSSGCDSIVTLALRTYPSYKVKDTLTLATQQLPYSIGDTIFQTDTQTGQYNIRLKTINGCDSIVSLSLKIVDGFIAEPLNLPLICADDPYFTISYKVTSGNVDSVLLLFDQKALNVGFSNIDRLVTGQTTVDVAMPQSVVPDNYTAVLAFKNLSGYALSYPLTFTVNYPSSIVLQKWNDVLALLNSKYNGGYEFSAYQWYRNGEIIPNATQSYIYIANGELDMNAGYSVKLTRTTDGTELFCCPVIPTRRSCVGVYPTLLSAGDMIKIDMPAAGTVAMYSLAGVIISETTLQPGANHIQVPALAGSYVLRIIARDNEIKRQLITVK